MPALNLGCYQDIKKGFVNLDKQKYCQGVDIVHDLEIFPYPFNNNYFDYVYARCVLEHITPQNRLRLMSELHRICKAGAIIHIEVPYKDKIYRGFDHLGGGFDFNTFKTLCGSREYIVSESFNLVSQSHKPSQFGRFIPGGWLRERLSYFFNNIVENVIADIKVVKDK